MGNLINRPSGPARTHHRESDSHRTRGARGTPLGSPTLLRTGLENPRLALLMRCGNAPSALSLALVPVPVPVQTARNRSGSDSFGSTNAMQHHETLPGDAQLPLCYEAYLSHLHRYCNSFLTDAHHRRMLSEIASTVARLADDTRLGETLGREHRPFFTSLDLTYTVLERLRRTDTVSTDTVNADAVQTRDRLDRIVDAQRHLYADFVQRQAEQTGLPGDVEPAQVSRAWDDCVKRANRVKVNRWLWHDHGKRMADTRKDVVRFVDAASRSPDR